MAWQKLAVRMIKNGLQQKYVWSMKVHPWKYFNYCNKHWVESSALTTTLKTSKQGTCTVHYFEGFWGFSCISIYEYIQLDIRLEHNYRTQILQMSPLNLLLHMSLLCVLLRRSMFVARNFIMSFKRFTHNKANTQMPNAKAKKSPALM